MSGQEHFMKILSFIFGILAVLLSDIMCAVLAVIFKRKANSKSR